MRFTSCNSALDLLTFSCVLLSKPAFACPRTLFAVWKMCLTHVKRHSGRQGYNDNPKYWSPVDLRTTPSRHMKILKKMHHGSQLHQSSHSVERSSCVCWPHMLHQGAQVHGSRDLMTYLIEAFETCMHWTLPQEILLRV